ncbi:MAG TPA: hypothetical protein VF614_14290 [Chthoniobacteraceae bacterium]|jgi:hypothetical protein
MKTTSLASLAVLTCSALTFAADQEVSTTSKQLQVYPKNLARQHVGTNLFLFNPANQTFTPTEASAAWLDDDITTGWPVMAGKQHYMLSFSEPQLLTNFAISARPASGKVTLYAGDEPAPPTAKSWTVVAKDIPIETINQHKLSKPFSRFAKYLLIETELADPGPLFSLYVYGDKPAVAYNLRDREQAIDTRAIFGPYVNNQTAFSTSGLYAQTRVTHANSADGFLSWQKVVDDNPETSVAIAPSTAEAGATIQLDGARQMSRVAVLTDAPAKGRLDLFVVATDAAAVPAEGSAATATSLEGLTPTTSINLDGSNSRTAIDFPSTSGDRVLVRWTPENGTDSLTVREINAFSGLSLASNELALSPEAVAEFGGSDTTGNSFKNFKDFKEPVAEGPADENPEPVASINKSPYLPGALGFPPIITGAPAPLSPQ